MKKAIFIFVAATMFIAGTIFTGCQSSDQKVEDAQAKVQDAKQELNAAKNDASAEAQKAANAEAWKTFRSEAEVKIRANELYIAELKEKMKKSGKKLDALYAKSIDELEQKNIDLKNRIEAYDKSQSDWESFKREFSHDMEELGKAMKDLTVNNEK